MHRDYLPAGPLLIGYDPYFDLPAKHLARLIDAVVETSLTPGSMEPSRGRPAFDLRLVIKVLVFGYSTGVRSSRQLERLCNEHLAFLYLTRGDTPSYRTLCSVRVDHKAELESVWVSLFAVAGRCGLARLGKVVVDSSKFRADVSGESVLKRSEYEAMLAELERILQEAQQTDSREDAEGGAGGTILAEAVPQDQMRDIVRQVRSQLSAAKKAKASECATNTQTKNASKADATVLASGSASTHAASSEAAAVTADATALEAAPVTADVTCLEATPQSADVTTLVAVSVINNTTSLQCNPANADDAVSNCAHTEVTRLSNRMLDRIADSIVAIKEAVTDGRKHVSLTDPDARMMPEGIQQRIREGYSFEVAVDNGLLVSGEVTQDCCDQQRLAPIVESASRYEPNGINSVDADSGYHKGDTVMKLINSGIDTCIPDVYTACDLHRGDPIGTTRTRVLGGILFTYDTEFNRYTCPEGNTLAFKREVVKRGQSINYYLAENVCTGCPLHSQCCKKADTKRRNLSVGQNHEILEQARQRFADESHRERYNQRGHAVETVFAFLRSSLGFTRWSLRGYKRVQCEGALFKIAYQMRKIAAASSKVARNAEVAA